MKFDALDKTDDAAVSLPSAGRALVIGALYQSLFRPVPDEQTVGRLSQEELRALYRAASLVEYVTLDDMYIQDMKYYFHALQSQRQETFDDILWMYKAFVASRRWKEANKIALQEPRLKKKGAPLELPESPFTNGEPTEIALDAGEHRFVRRGANTHLPVQIIVVAHPDCHFSQSAIRAIEADPVLGGIFLAHAKWLAPQESDFDFESFEQWNQRHPGQELSVAFQRKEWPMIDTWNLPTFYFFKDGALRAKLFGWPEGGRRSEVLAALQQVGLSQ